MLDLVEAQVDNASFELVFLGDAPTQVDGVESHTQFVAYAFHNGKHFEVQHVTFLLHVEEGGRDKDSDFWGFVFHIGGF